MTDKEALKGQVRQRRSNGDSFDDIRNTLLARYSAGESQIVNAAVGEVEAEEHRAAEALSRASRPVPSGASEPGPGRPVPR